MHTRLIQNFAVPIVMAAVLVGATGAMAAPSHGETPRFVPTVATAPATADATAGLVLVAHASDWHHRHGERRDYRHHRRPDYGHRRHGRRVSVVRRPCQTRVIRRTPYGRVVEVIETCGSRYRGPRGWRGY
ncbi:hypothetical protein [Acuticoccus mangrovi]|uniref:Secreted protein n=1 Tax=Acuticoccus mangrovi TaxID=2796142 RepID=A0A934IS31_9HYPH|nr:hypothetical protein [Acuticoccus mangrovi]MBJ3777202.1 hypothetical protein [Acuticoccus mangrovi]